MSADGKLQTFRAAKERQRREPGSKEQFWPVQSSTKLSANKF